MSSGQINFNMDVKANPITLSVRPSLLGASMQHNQLKNHLTILDKEIDALIESQLRVS